MKVSPRRRREAWHIRVASNGKKVFTAALALRGRERLKSNASEDCSLTFGKTGRF